jgi:C4-dicarboxylate-specific signal transduction histidine kinase
MPTTLSTAPICSGDCRMPRCARPCPLVQDVHEGVRRIERIITDLKDFARPRTPGAPETFALSEAVQRALRLLTHVIRRKTMCFRT